MIDIKLEPKGISTPPESHPIYKIVMILAILKYGVKRNSAASLLKLNIYLWSLRSDENYNIFHSLSSQKRKYIIPWNPEPGLEQILNLMVANQYCSKEIVNKKLKIKLEAKGDVLLSQTELIFMEDMNKIKTIGVIAESIIEHANETWVLK